MVGHGPHTSSDHCHSRPFHSLAAAVYCPHPRCGPALPWAASAGRFSLLPPPSTASPLPPFLALLPLCRSNGMGSWGAAALAEALKSNTSLKKLYLEYVLQGGGGALERQ